MARFILIAGMEMNGKCAFRVLVESGLLLLMALGSTGDTISWFWCYVYEQGSSYLLVPTGKVGTVVMSFDWPDRLDCNISLYICKIAC